MEVGALDSTVRSLFLKAGHTSASAAIQHLPGITRGLSCRSVRRFCQSRGMLRLHTLGESELDECVRTYLLRVGHAYGRRTMQGLLRCNGIEVSQSVLIAALLRCVAPIHYCARMIDAYCTLNPFPYFASYYGEKLQWNLDLRTLLGPIQCVLNIGVLIKEF